MQLTQKVTLGLLKNVKKHPFFKSGDVVSVHVKVKEGSKERIQVFKGTVLKVRGEGMGRNFTVRKISGGVGVERTFPFTSPVLNQIVVESRGKVRQSRLFYLRQRKGRAARIEMKRDDLSFSEKKKTSSKTSQQEEEQREEGFSQSTNSSENGSE